MTVSKDDDGTWRYECGRPSGCGADGVPFHTSGWATKAAATTRGAQHDDEHVGGQSMPSLDDFRKSLTAKETD